MVAPDFLGAVVVSYNLAFLIIGLDKWLKLFLEDRKNSGHFASSLDDARTGPAAALVVFVLPIAYVIAPASVAPWSLLMYFVLALGGSVLLGVCFLLDPFNRLRRYHLFRPTVFVDAYDDPRSGHWLVPATDRTPPRG